MSKDQYKSGKDSIAAGYKSAKTACGSLSGNANDIRKAEASGKEKVAKAKLEAKYKPSENAGYKLCVARQTPITRWPGKNAMLLQATRKAIV